MSQADDGYRPKVLMESIENDISMTLRSLLGKVNIAAESTVLRSRVASEVGNRDLMKYLIEACADYAA